VKNGLLLPIFGLGLAWFFFKKMNSTGGVAYDNSSAEGLTRLLLAETSFNRPKKEMVGICQVAINRAKKGTPLVDVVTPPGKPNWNASTKFRIRWNESINWPQYGRARRFVDSVLSGEFINPIGDRTQFLHPRGMPSCDGKNCPAGRVCSDTVAGKRCLPKWSTVNVKTVGGARFS